MSIFHSSLHHGLYYPHPRNTSLPSPFITPPRSNRWRTEIEMGGGEGGQRKFMQWPLWGRWWDRSGPFLSLDRRKPFWCLGCISWGSRDKWIEYLLSYQVVSSDTMESRRNRSLEGCDNGKTNWGLERWLPRGRSLMIAWEGQRNGSFGNWLRRRREIPNDSFLFVCVSVLETFYLTSLTSKQSMKTIISIRLRKDKEAGISGKYFGPTLFPPEASVVWHWAHRVYNQHLFKTSLSTN